MKKYIKKLSFITILSIMSCTLFGCDYLDELLEPEQKTYNSTIYNKTNEKDKNFNNYDGVKTEETTEDTTEEETTIEENLLDEENKEPEKGIYYFDFEETKDLTITQNGDNAYTIVFSVPEKMIDFTNIPDIKKPKKQIINKKKNAWTGPYYKYYGNDNQTVKAITAIYNLEDFDSLDAMVTMNEGTFKKLSTETNTKTIQEGNLLQLVVNGYTEVYYRIYPYESEVGKSAIIMSAAKIDDKYMYTEFWLDGSFDSMNYEDFIVNIYNSARCTLADNVVFE